VSRVLPRSICRHSFYFPWLGGYFSHWQMIGQPEPGKQENPFHLDINKKKSHAEAIPQFPWPTLVPIPNHEPPSKQPFCRTTGFLAALRTTESVQHRLFGPDELIHDLHPAPNRAPNNNNHSKQNRVLILLIIYLVRSRKYTIGISHSVLTLEPCRTDHAVNPTNSQPPSKHIHQNDDPTKKLVNEESSARGMRSIEQLMFLRSTS